MEIKPRSKEALQIELADLMWSSQVAAYIDQADNTIHFCQVANVPAGARLLTVLEVAKRDKWWWYFIRN